jgi:hypothetical protein
MSRPSARKATTESPTPPNATAIEDISLGVQTSTLTDPNFMIPEHAKGREITRKVVLQWDNNLAALAARPNQATWRPLDGHYDIFQSRTRYAPNCVRSDVKRGNLEQAILIGMKVKKVDSNFPCQLGLSIHGVKGNYNTCNGERYAYLISAGERNLSMDEIVATTNPYVNSEYLERFPGMTATALREQGIMQVPNENYVFVDKSHPVVEMMQENAEALHIDLAQAQLIDGRWYKVAKPVTERCLNELESELVNNLPIYNLTEFKASINRPYGMDWDAENEICDNLSMANLKSKVMAAERRCTVVLELSYLFM